MHYTMQGCNVYYSIPALSLSVKEKRRWTPAALRRKMLHFHNMSTCLFIDFETGGFIRKCVIQVLEVWFRSAKLRRTLSCHDRRARVRDSFNEKWHPIIDILALWAPYIGSWGVLINACWWSHIAYITIPCPEFDHGKWIKPQIVTFQVGFGMSDPEISRISWRDPEFHEEISRPWDSTPAKDENLRPLAYQSNLYLGTRHRVTTPATTWVQRFVDLF